MSEIQYKKEMHFFAVVQFFAEVHFVYARDIVGFGFDERMMSEIANDMG